MNDDHAYNNTHFSKQYQVIVYLKSCLLGEISGTLTAEYGHDALVSKQEKSYYKWMSRATSQTLKKY